MKKYVHHICERCLVCKNSKSKSLPHGLYTPLPILISAWIDIFMEDILFLFLKMTYFILFHKVDACHVANLFFKEVVRLYDFPRSIVLVKGTLDSSNIFGELYRVSLELSYSFPPLVIHKGMDKWKILSQLLRCFIRKNLWSWEDCLPYIEFTYNRVINNTISHSPFPFELAQLHMEKKVEQYARHANKGKMEFIFNKGDLVWVHLRKERFPSLKKSKNFSRGKLFKILEKINGNVYKTNFPLEYRGSNNLNVSDLSPCFVGTQTSNLRSNYL
ncbi:hypothetical protein CR513_44930, partial [Mucuna pruriens]